ncbi:MAG: phosphoribosyltransferase family protein [Planctomycetota bacterium]
MFREIDRTLIDADAIERRVTQMAGELAEGLAADIERTGVERVAVIPIMTGALVFTADLIRRLPLKLSLELVTVSSYPGRTTESKGVALRGAIPEGLSGAHVVVIDDILDSGRTLATVRDLVLEQSPASLRFVVLLNKSARREQDITAEHVGFEIPDEFVVGYGLDFDGYYRNLPAIATLRPEHVQGASGGG